MRAYFNVLSICSYYRLLEASGRVIYCLRYQKGSAHFNRAIETMKDFKAVLIAKTRR